MSEESESLTECFEVLSSSFFFISLINVEKSQVEELLESSSSSSFELKYLSSLKIKNNKISMINKYLIYIAFGLTCYQQSLQ